MCNSDSTKITQEEREHFVEIAMESALELENLGETIESIYGEDDGEFEPANVD